MMKAFKRMPVTMTLLLVTVVVFLAMQVVFFGQATTAYAVFAAGGMYGDVVKAFPSQSWRLLSPIFVHIGWEHLILNGLALYFVGSMAEQIFGRWRFLLLYILSGLMGNLFTLFFTPSSVAAGASTSLFGVFASFAVLGYFGDNPYLKQLGRQYQLLIGLNLIFNLFSTETSMTGHLGGAVGGVLCAVFLPNHLEKSVFKTSTRFQAFVVYLGLALVLYLVALAG